MHEKVKCVECHVKPAFTNVGKNCADCHADIHRRQMGPNCEQCHTVQGWNIAVQQVKDHQNRFPLLGAHAAVQCEECHKQAATGIFFGLSTQCDSCHLKDWQNTTNPPHAADPADFPSASCQGCHTTFDSWLGATFGGNHAAPPISFPLTGGHNVPCQQCHVNNNFHLQIAFTDCGNAGCHLTTWQQTNNPPHPKAGPAFAASNCYGCHSSTVSWSIVTFDHSTTGFPLTNGHANVPCATCHINNNYNLTIAPTDCGNSSCHLTTWQQTNNPVHSAAGSAFATANCAGCHNTTSWTTVTFDHSTTGFPLTNGHANVPCATCHINNNYNLQIAPTDCGNSACHLTTWQQTNNPVHSTSGRAFGAANCANCHTTVGWDAASFNHSVTGFALTGAHATTACALCHISNNYSLTSANTDCYGCHQDKWNSTASMGGNVPNHVTAGFPTSLCSQCHDTTTWANSTFNHTSTGLALVGTHATTTCASCHVNNNYSLSSANTDCMGCHLSSWNSTQTLGGNVPNHVASNFPTTAAACSSCHPITTWSAGTFDHSATGFPLANSHQMTPAGKVTACTQCHIGGNYTLSIQPTDCGNAGCHLTTWQQTNNPTHSTAGSAFATANCSTCHDTITWTDSTFNHSVTGFALTGAHATTACALCHVSNNYNLTSANTDCYGCHQTAWTSTQTLGGAVPNHVAANFPNSLCSTCHDTIAWVDGKFDHSTTGWALTGGHQMVPAAGGVITACTQCHVSNNYSLTAANTVCYGCHVADWNSTVTLGGSVPNHVAAGYPTTCDTCHTTTSWLGATFNHTYFPIPHHGSVCNDCHQVSTNYASFTCINCHTTTAHQQTQTNNEHGGVNGYSYGPETCYSCHKNGGGG